jgi:membrane protein implicated in regulation of membrane protease activity
MNETLNDAVIWFCIGFAFFVLEFLVPGFILFFFGIGAWFVAALSLYFDVSINAQIILFISSSVLTVMLFRKWVKNKLGMTGVNSNQLDDEFIGKIGRAETAIIPGSNGKVDFKGTSWDATSNDVISAGENVMITETRSILLVVKSHKTL